MKSNEIERLVGKIRFRPSTATDERIIARVNAVLDKSTKAKSANLKPNIWRTIMKTKITTFAAAAVLIIAVLIGINEFGGSSIAFGDILENIEKAKTLAWKTTLVTEGQNPRITRTMVLEPYYMRVELEDGTVWILDRSQGKTLILDPSRKIAVISSTAKTSPDILEICNTFENFKNMEGFLVEEVGQQQIDGKSSIGFRLTKEDESQQIMVWADIETELPILIETTITDTQSSHVFQSITSDIVFGVELDEVLFNIEPPEGYKKQSIFVPANPTPEFRRAQSATNIYRILKICLDYVEENGGEWPNSLYDLVNYGLPKETLVNPRQPKRENGYVYLKPEERLSPSDDIILYEAYDGWGGGINVGFADGHIDFIKEESDFNKRLLK